MNRIAVIGLLLFVSLPVYAVGNGEVRYVGGTVSGLRKNAVGRLNISSDTSLAFESQGNNLAVLYASIESFEYSKEVARHLGVLPAILTGLMKQRQYRHFLRITYRDQNHVSQLAIFEVPKDMPRTLQSVLDARVPGVWKTSPKCGCRN